MRNYPDFFGGEIISVSHGNMVLYSNQDFMVHVPCKLLSTAQMEPEPVRSWKKVSGFHTSIYKPVDIFIDICFCFFSQLFFRGVYLEPRGSLFWSEFWP